MNTYLLIFRASFPIVLARLIQTLGFIIGGFMIALLGPDALAASAFSTTISITFFTFCSGSLFSLAKLISIAHAKQDIQQVLTILMQGIYFAAILSLIVLYIFYHIEFLLGLFHVPPKLINLLVEYYIYFGYSVLPMLCTTAIQECIIGCHKQNIIFRYSIFRLIVGSIFSYIFIFGKFGIPKFGFAGLGLSITVASWFSLFCLVIYLFIRYYRIIIKHISNKIFLLNKHFASIMKLGFPIGVQMSGEILAITVATLLMGKFGVYALSAQQITSQYLLIVTMIPFGISHAITVLISRSITQGNFIFADELQNKSLKLIIFIMLFFGTLYIFIPQVLATIFIHNTDYVSHKKILQLTIQFFYIMAIYQLFDGVRNVICGILYGYGKTFLAMLFGLGSFWLVGIPLAWIFGFYFNFGVLAIPVSLTIAVALASGFSFWYCFNVRNNHETVRFL